MLDRVQQFRSDSFFLPLCFLSVEPPTFRAAQRFRKIVALGNDMFQSSTVQCVLYAGIQTLWLICIVLQCLYFLFYSICELDKIFTLGICGKYSLKHTVVSFNFFYLKINLVPLLKKKKYEQNKIINISNEFSSIFFFFQFEVIKCNYSFVFSSSEMSLICAFIIVTSTRVMPGNTFIHSGNHGCRGI